MNILTLAFRKGTKTEPQKAPCCSLRGERKRIDCVRLKFVIATQSNFLAMNQNEHSYVGASEGGEEGVIEGSSLQW